MRDLSDTDDVTVAVENMSSERGGSARDVVAPSWNPGELDIDALTLDFSHAGMTGRPVSELAAAWGNRLRHVHLCDSSRDSPQGPLVGEHPPPGHGVLPVDDVVRALADHHFEGLVVAEITTRHRGRDEEERATVLAGTMRFARTHLRVNAT